MVYDYRMTVCKLEGCTNSKHRANYYCDEHKGTISSKLDPYADEIKHLYSVEGLTDLEIAKHLGVGTKEGIYAWRLRNDVPTLSTMERGDLKFDEAKMHELWNLHGSIKHVAKELGISTSKTKRWLTKAGIDSDRKKYNPSVDIAVDMYLEGHTADHISKVVGVTPVTVCNWLRLEGVEILSSMARSTEEETKAIVDKISLTKLSEEARSILASAESLSVFIDANPGVGLRGMAELIGCSYPSLNKRVHDFGLWSKFLPGSSELERSIQESLEAIGVSGLEKAPRHIDGRYEVDFLHRELGIGIEANGSYWHSERAGVRPNYHQQKSALALNQGIFLYHIFEYEWYDDRARTAILGQLRNLFGLNSKSIGARKCEVVTPEPWEKNQFLNENHTQGEDRSSVHLGLKHDDELVAVMTFGKPRFKGNSGHEWELYRFATKIGVNVPGGASKLFSHFVSEYSPQSILSYSDNAKTRGGMYASLGFELLRESSPGYVWTNFREVMSRYKVWGMKNEVKEMTNKGYTRIYDCGNKVWLWTP